MILIASYFLCVLYAAFILIFIIGWNRMPFFHGESRADMPFLVSVVVPLRNESVHILRLLQALEKQTYQYIEVILVDDHSIDHSFSVISDYITGKKHISVIRAAGEGKKNALIEGIANSTGSLIVCTDADCVPHQCWIETIADFYEENHPDMIIAPVVMTFDNTAFRQMQALEFMSLQASTAGAACAGFPIMCNGANMAFTREAWDNNSANLKHQKLSGDDMFLMMSIKKKKGKISYLKSDKAVVFTAPSNSVSEFFNQRKRWVSKSSSYRDRDVILSALSVFGVSFVIILNLVLAIFVNSSYWIPFAFIFLVKIIVDRILLFSFGRFVRSSQLLRWVFPLSLIYPFYVITTAISGLFGKFDWKGRRS